MTILLSQSPRAPRMSADMLSPDGVEAEMVAALPHPGWLREKVIRYIIATIGPVSSAATQFALSLLMLRLMSHSAFGIFTFLLVASQLSWGIWSALFCAPLPVLLINRTDDDRLAGETTLLSANLLGALFAFFVFGTMAWSVGMSPTTALCYAAYGAVALLRWFGRAYCYVQGHQIRTVLSDVIYSVTVIVTLCVTALPLKCDPQLACYASLLAGALMGMMSFGRTYFARQFRVISARSLKGYGAVWQGQARWALLGVMTTEATANAHVYLITLLMGPAAFAPIAASALLMRPVNVAQNALSDFERPQMAALIGKSDAHAIRRSLSAFRFALGAIWLGTVAAAVLVFAIDPAILFPHSYDIHFLVVATILWSLVAALRLVQIPESTLLQAAGEFRPLAMASLWSSIGSVISVFILIIMAGTLWSIAGIVAGAAIYWLWTRRFAAAWLADYGRQSAHVR